jgi:uncharacterized protein YqeY
MALKDELKQAMKAAMKGGDKSRLAAIRLIQAEIKRVEVDERVELDDDRVLVILDKMQKQRRDSIAQFEGAGRDDLAAVEKSELAVIQDFLPAALDDNELAAIVDAAIATSGAGGMKDMGKVMGIIKPQVQGRADMGQVSQLVKSRLAD